MTVVDFDLRTPSPDGAIPADSRVSWQPVERILGPDYVVLKARTSVPLVDGVALASIDPGLYWFMESAPGGESAFRIVPPVGPVNYRDLAAVDPATLETTAAPTAAWYAYTDGLEAAAQGAAGSAEASQLAAEGSQTSALASATAAGNSATASAGSATAADLSKIAAGNSAAAASGSANSAAGSASTATTRAQEAANSASAADTSKLDAQTAAAGAASSRDTMVNGGSVDVSGHLILARVGAAPLDAGYVVGPPPVLTVLETTTGPETPGATGQQGLKGDKGDPGGIVTTSLGTADLNLITVDGVYRQNSGGQATLARNYPSAGVLGDLFVIQASTASWMRQEFHPNGTPNEGRVFWVRVCAGGTWRPWQAFYSQRLDVTAGRARYAWDDTYGREQLVYGDTGWRDVRGLVINGWTSTQLMLRRVGQVVFLAGNIVGGAATSDHFLPLQAGFQPVSGLIYGHASTAAAAGNVWRALGHDGTNHYVTSGGTTPTYVLQGSYPTVAPWPTTLPGVPSGAIPNL